MNHKSGKLIRENKLLIRCKKGQQIFFEGAPVTGIFFILEGKVKVFKSGINGRQQIVRLARSGDILGHRGFGGNNIYPVGASTLEDSKICFIESSVFFNTLKNEPELAIQLLLFYAEELKTTETKLRNQAQMTIREKITDALLYIYERYHVDGDNTLDVHLSRQDIADLAGTNREQISRLITEFEYEGIIKTKGKRIEIIRLNKMQAILTPFHTN
ncbi:MAG: Crp/Fnr family transcriptional regulator [Bacteroidia bacterium]|nr:Crp/Fnr family transcriptional regulator [Bacteroidia bacterium]MCZ2277555.1 Crp/Fnr family transcriptional regulator [Bacteroidia bacterium]